ncbi:MAG: ExeM/NucH family extracellular endonuclease [Xanthomonadales bacterium]|nr:ExeM/NucH family extracellular endonuclease [Gammaproteobacteria bacterium]MBT8054352.1 ExeM/NucH family extracellular endonuclease [Gammaproteobacteria bacterium]NND57336.1 ExeM/NucH family extracellular endonuclease [Xanthomonadales bacterium]
MRRLLPVLLLGVFAGACSEPGALIQPGESPCRGDVTPITAVQGDGYQSPLVDTVVTVRGVVTRVDAGKGFYLESIGFRGDTRASKAIFIADSDLPGSAWTGRQLEISGRVTELGTSRDTLTSLTEIASHKACTERPELPLTQAALPLDSPAREALEGMRISLQQPLTVTDVYQLARGALTLSSADVLRVPTEVANPGSAAQDRERTNRRHTIVTVLPEAPAPLPVGSSTQAVAGVMGHNGRGQQLLLDDAPAFTVPSMHTLEPAAAGRIRMVSSNLLNFFNGDGRGGGFPTERGAETPDELAAQSARIKAVMTRIRPDLVAVQELENDGFGPDSAAQSLLALLNETGNTDWAFITPGAGRIGEDVITVGLFYRQKVLEAVGQPHVLGSGPFRGLSRQPLAQLFRDKQTGKTFLVASNHLKSKGSCPEDGPNSNQKDGQGCWNPARVAAVKAQLPWLRQLAEQAGSGRLLILGDMNAWRNEDPIRQFNGAGYIDLVEKMAGLPQHSFLYWGQTGTLDYAFASPALAGLARYAVNWHINADWPREMTQSEPWLRASDHDPVIVDFDFSQPVTSD